MIRLLNRYVILRLSVSTLYTLLALLALYFFFDVVSESGDIGEGTYTFAKLTVYVLMLVPSHAYELMPLAVLAGALVALSRLTSTSELTVIKTSGVSLAGIIRMLMQYGLIFAVFTVVLGEWVVPSLGRYAERYKLYATQDLVSAGTYSGIWIKQNNDIINVGAMMPDSSLVFIKVYHYNENFQLTETISAQTGRPDKDAAAGWHLQQVSRTKLLENRTVSSTADHLMWPINIDRRLLNVLLVPPEQMSAPALSAYIGHLENNHQQTTRYRLAWWRKFSYPLACLVMALVALAFTPQQARRGNIGIKLFAGICLGLVFHFAGRLFGFTSQLYGVPVFIAAFLPTAAFLIFAVWLIRRAERR